MIFAATGAQLRYAMFHVKHAASNVNQKNKHKKFKLEKTIIKIQRCYKCNIYTILSLSQ